MKYPKELLERFVQITAVLSIIIVFLGFLNLLFYYNEFNFNIIDYISISEVITSSFSLFLLLLLPFIIVFLIIRTFVLKTSQEIEDTKVHKMVNRFLAILLSTFLFTILIMMILSLFGNKFMKEFYNGKSLYLIVTIYFLILSCFLLIFRQYLKESIDIWFIKKVPSMAFAFVCLLVAFYINSKRKALLIVDETDITTFSFSNESILATNDSIKYLGKTEGYFFLWNKNTKESIIYPAFEIKKVVIKPYKSESVKVKKSINKEAQFNQIDAKP